jgi:hypothetical protein
LVCSCSFEKGEFQSANASHIRVFRYHALSSFGKSAGIIFLGPSCVLKQITAACDETIKRFNAPDSAIQNVARINEVSSHFEDTLRQLLNAAPGLNCNFPGTAEGRVQRSGYPDRRIVDTASKRVFYLDPKLYVAGSRDSSFRSFYFEPKVATNKVHDDAVHLVVGFEHELRQKNGAWKFTRWDLVDLAQFKVKLKAEFQGSNRDMYRPEAIVASSAK